jgi:hypothetical protein
MKNSVAKTGNVSDKPVTSEIKANQLKLIGHLNLSNASFSSTYSAKKLFDANRMKKENSAPPIHSDSNSVQVVTCDDPLGAFKSDQQQREATPSTITGSSATVDRPPYHQPSANRILNNFDDIKRRLFDYKPFADQAKTSDFLFERPAAAQLKQPVAEQQQQPSSNDSDIYSDSQDEESFENESAGNQSGDLYENEFEDEEERVSGDDDDYDEDELDDEEDTSDTG